MRLCLANEESISRTLFQDQTGLTTVNTSDIHTRARTRLLSKWQERWSDSEMGCYCYSIVPSVSIEAWMEDGFHGRSFWWLCGVNHTGTRAHLQRINVVQDALC
jgi:hypothetical protein